MYVCGIVQDVTFINEYSLVYEVCACAREDVYQCRIALKALKVCKVFILSLGSNVTLILHIKHIMIIQ